MIPAEAWPDSAAGLDCRPLFLPKRDFESHEIFKPSTVLPDHQDRARLLSVRRPDFAFSFVIRLAE